MHLNFILTYQVIKMSNKEFVFKQSFGSVKYNNVKKLTEQSFGKAVKENENRKFI